MLSDVASAGVEKQDLRDLGLLMIRLMELGTSLTNPKSLELQAPEKWKDQIKIFLRKTQECSGETLLQVRGINECYKQRDADSFRMCSSSSHLEVIVLNR